MNMFPMGALPLSTLASLASGASPSDLLRMGQSNPSLVSALAGRVQRNPKEALALAGSLVKKNSGKARGLAMSARAPVERGVMRINRPSELGRVLKIADKAGVTPMLAGYGR